MKKTVDIFEGINILDFQWRRPLYVNNLRINSEKVDKGDLFVAIRGYRVDGHSYINQAIENGARVVVVEKMPKIKKDGVTYVKVKNTRKTLAYLTRNFYKNPSSKIRLIAITGTNGKTSITTLLYQVFKQLGYSVGLISTINIKINDDIIDTNHTTPDTLTLNRILNEMVQKGVAYCFMEVSSHAIAQKRIETLEFDVAVFTNLTHDHLDYHKTFKDYRDIKKQLFDGLSKSSVAITNSDDRNGHYMVQNTSARIVSYGMKMESDIRAKVIEASVEGTEIILDEHRLSVMLTGDFNIYNLLCVYAVTSLYHSNKLEVFEQLSRLNFVEGRFEKFRSSREFYAIIDYAHTPDALKNILKSIAYILPVGGRIISVIGCGGNRDKSKRPLMAKIGAYYSDLVLITSDNPRDEDPNMIVEDMLSGILSDDLHKVIQIEDREKAIKKACAIAQKGDVILIAGKGHEAYQEIKGVKYRFKDKDVLTKYID